MIVTLTGAYRNAGDHLIGARARALLRAHVDEDVVDIDRKAINPEHYDLFRRARAVLLCGGPAYQPAIYPKIYPLALDRISSPVVPFGLGWKATRDAIPANFAFNPEAEAFVRRVHERIPVSSARDVPTVELLNLIDCRNVIMTGCPAWYHLPDVERPYTFSPHVRTLVVSMPANFTPSLGPLLDRLSVRFRQARRILSFHHGLVPAPTIRGRSQGVRHALFALAASLRGWRSVGLAGSLERLEQLYDAADLHIGFRVHAHLYCLSRRIASLLIAEDSRGVSQARTLSASPLKFDPDDMSPIEESIDMHFHTGGEDTARSVETMRRTYPEMRRFLATL